MGIDVPNEVEPAGTPVEAIVASNVSLGTVEGPPTRFAAGKGGGESPQAAKSPHTNARHTQKRSCTACVESGACLH